MEEAPRKVVMSVSTGSVIKVLIALGLAAVLLYLMDVVLVLLTAIIIATAVEPAIKWLVSFKVPRIIATFIIYVGLLGIISAFFYFIVPPFLDDLASFMVMLPKKVTALNVNSPGLGTDFFSWQKALQGLSSSESLGQAAQNLATSLSTASQSILGTLTTVFGGVLSFFLIIVLSFYLAVQDAGIEDFLRLITPLKHEQYILGFWRRTQHKISRWIQGQFILAIIVGFLVYIGLRIFQVQNPLFLAMISAVFEIIPVFGPFVGSIPGVLVAFTQGGLPFGIVIALMYLVILQIESNVIYPLVAKKVLHVPAIVVVIALVVGAKLGGLLGVLLSVPIAAVLTEFMADVGKNRTAARAKLSDNVL